MRALIQRVSRAQVSFEGTRRSKGRRPDFTAAMAPAQAKSIYESFVTHLKAQGLRVETGEFGANMQVELVNDGPVTLWLDIAAR